MDYKKYLPIIIGIVAVVAFFLMSKQGDSQKLVQTQPQIEPVQQRDNSGYQDALIQERTQQRQIVAGLFTDLLGYQSLREQNDVRLKLAAMGKDFN